VSGEAKEIITVGLVAKDLALILFGALVGLGASEYTAWRRRREDQKKEAINIITEVVKYLLKINTLTNDFKDRMTFFAKRANDPQIAKEYREYCIKTHENLSELEVEELFREFQLDLVDNQNIRKKFRPLINAYNEYGDAFDKDFKIFKEKEAVYRKLYKDFMNLCLETCKANAPKCTLSAPDKKKGLAENG